MPFGRVTLQYWHNLHCLIKCVDLFNQATDSMHDFVWFKASLKNRNEANVC